MPETCPNIQLLGRGLGQNGSTSNRGNDCAARPAVKVTNAVAERFSLILNLLTMVAGVVGQALQPARRFVIGARTSGVQLRCRLQAGPTVPTTRSVPRRPRFRNLAPTRPRPTRLPRAQLRETCRDLVRQDGAMPVVLHIL